MKWPDWIKDGVVQRVESDGSIIGEFVWLDPLIHSLRWVESERKPAEPDWDSEAQRVRG